MFRLHNAFFLFLLLLMMTSLSSSCAVQNDTVSSPSQEDIFHDPIDSSCSYFYFLWGNTAEYQSRYEEALEAYQKASICDPQAEYIQEKIPALLMRLGRAKEAEVWLEQYIQNHPENVAQRLLLAQLKIQQKKEEEAIHLYRQALTADPDNTSILLRLGALHAKQKQWQQARNIFQKALEKDSDSYFATLYLARLYAETDNYSAAEQRYKEALQLNWSKPLSYEIAEFYNLHKQYLKAQDTYKTILARDSRDERAALGVVQTYLFLQDGESALQELTKIRDYTQKPARIDLVRSQILINIGENKRAKDILLTLLEDNEFPQAQYLLGVIFYEELNFSAASNILQKIPPDAPEYPESVMLQVRIFEESNKSAQSIELLEDVIKQKDARQPAHYSLLASIHQKMKAPEKALQVLAQAISVYNQNEALHYEYAILQEKQGNHAEAMELMHRILELNSNNADALNFIGYSWADDNINLEKAYEYIRKALELKPKSGYIQDSLGWVFYRMSKFEKAREALEKAAEMEPQDPYIFEHLGDTYKALKKHNQARYYYQKAIKLLRDNEKIYEIKEKIKQLDR